MLFDFEDDVEIACRTVVRAGLAFAGDAQARSGVDSRRNAELDGLLAFEAALSAAFRATLADDLSRALASGAGSRNGEESLLVGQLAAAGAGLASNDASALLRARAVAGFAEFLPRQLDFGRHTSSSFFKRQRHVIAQVSAALRAGAPAASAAAEEIFEAEKIAEDVVEILEDGIVKTLAHSCAGKTCVTVGVVDLALLRIAEDAIGFGAFAEFRLRFGFVFRIAIRMPFQRGFAVGGFDFIDRRRPRNGRALRNNRVDSPWP